MRSSSLWRLKITEIADIKISSSILKASIIEKSFATSLVISMIFTIIAVVFISIFLVRLLLLLLRNTARDVLLLFSIVIVNSRVVDLGRFVRDILIVIKPPAPSSPTSTVPKTSS